MRAMTLSPSPQGSSCNCIETSAASRAIPSLEGGRTQITSSWSETYSGKMAARFTPTSAAATPRDREDMLEVLQTLQGRRHAGRRISLAAVYPILLPIIRLNPSWSPSRSTTFQPGHACSRYSGTSSQQRPHMVTVIVSSSIKKPRTKS